MTTCETCNDTHSMSLRGSLVPCTRCPTPCQECRINGRGAYCAKTPCACACHAIVDRHAPTLAVTPGLDLDAVERAERAMTPGPWRWGDWGATYGLIEGEFRYTLERAPAYPIDACAIRDKHCAVSRILTMTNDGAESEADAAGIVALRNAAPALIAEVRALRAEVAAAKWPKLRAEIARITAELDAARAVTADVCRYLDCSESDLLAVVTSLYESRARAISDATAARGTVGGLLATAPVARPISEWHEDHGDALWWRFPIEEPPYCGSPISDDWPGDYHTHWTPIVCPDDPTQRGPLPKGG